MRWGMGERFKREGTHVYLWLIHFVVWQKPRQHFEAIIRQLKINLKKKDGSGNSHCRQFSPETCVKGSRCVEQEGGCATEVLFCFKERRNNRMFACWWERSTERAGHRSPIFWQEPSTSPSGLWLHIPAPLLDLTTWCSCAGVLRAPSPALLSPCPPPSDLHSFKCLCTLTSLFPLQTSPQKCRCRDFYWVSPGSHANPATGPAPTSFPHLSFE